MSYYNPSFSQTFAMSRGGGRGYSPRGSSSSYRGSSSSYRGSSSRGWGGGSSRGGYSPRGSSSSRYSGGGSNSYESRPPKFEHRPVDKFSSSRNDDYRRSSYRPESNYSVRDHRSPERKRPRQEAPPPRHDSGFSSSYGSSRYENNYTERRSYSGDRHGSVSRRDDFRRPSGPPRGGYRGRMSSRRPRDFGPSFRGSRRPPLNTRRRLIDTSYAVKKRTLAPRSTIDYARRLKISKLRSAIARRGGKRSLRLSDKEDSDEEKEDEENDEENAKESETEKKDGEEGAKPAKKEAETGKDEEKTPKKGFIKLHCPHCNNKAATFRKYEIHLSSRTHLIAMRKIAMKQKMILSQMRQAQRNTQNELEKSSEDLASRTNFCPLCKLNYKQKKITHQASEAHKNMKKFLMPFCKVCNVTFKSPMIYESHCCSIEHIKRKQRVDHSDESAEEDLENFTTIDSVGDGDEKEEKEEEGKEQISVGIEQIRKVESYFCDLCKMYLTKGTESDTQKILARHCKQRIHMQRYVRYKERKELEERAEKLQRKETAEKEKKDKEVKEGEVDEKMEVDATAKDVKEGVADTTNDDDIADDKLWEDVDKDLGNLIAEAQDENKSSDEDDDSHVNGERFDRFKLSEKNGEEKKITEKKVVEVKEGATEEKAEAEAKKAE